MNLSEIRNASVSRADIQAASTEWAAPYAQSYRSQLLENVVLRHGRATAMGESLSGHALDESVMAFCQGRSELVGAAGRRSWLGVFESVCHDIKSERPDQSQHDAIEEFSTALNKLDKTIFGRKYQSETAGTNSGHVKNATLAKHLVAAEEKCAQVVEAIGKDVIFQRLFQKYVLPATAARAMKLFGDVAFSEGRTLNNVMISQSVSAYEQAINALLDGPSFSYAGIQAASRLLFTLPDLIQTKEIEQPGDKAAVQTPAAVDKACTHEHCSPVTVTQTNTNQPSAGSSVSDAVVLKILELLDRALKSDGGPLNLRDVRNVNSGSTDRSYMLGVDTCTETDATQKSDVPVMPEDKATGTLGLRSTSDESSSVLGLQSLLLTKGLDAFSMHASATRPQRVDDRSRIMRSVGDIVNDRRKEILDRSKEISEAWKHRLGDSDDSSNMNEGLGDVIAGRKEDDMFDRRMVRQPKGVSPGEAARVTKLLPTQTSSVYSLERANDDGGVVGRDDMQGGIIDEDDMFLRRINDANRLNNQVIARRQKLVSSAQLPGATRS